MDPRGGKRIGAGRKSKAEELSMIEKLTPLQADAFKALSEGIRKRDFRYVQLYFAYQFGKPQERVDLTTNGNDLKPMSITLNLLG